VSVRQRLAINPMRKSVKPGLLAVFATILIAATFTDAHYVRSYPGGTLLRRGDEAYLFLATGQTGYRFSWLKFPFVLLGGYFYAPPVPEYQYGSTTVIHITPASTDSQRVEFGEDISRTGQFFTPYNDGFYAMCNGGRLCRWTNTGFQPATEEEERRFGGIGHLVRGDINNKDISGWSIYQIGRSRGQLQMSVGGKSTLSVDVKATFPQEYAKFSIRLARPGQPEQILYAGDGTPKLISGAEYRRDFSEKRSKP
jgi:hypothetical protein